MTAASVATRLFIRATVLDDRVIGFASELEAASGLPATFVLDERHGRYDATACSIVGISDAKCRALGLYCPSDYAWRCGDYGYYLARRQFPDACLLWMIEYDVRFTGDCLSQFFKFFDVQSSVDFLATGYEAADWTWYWSLTSRGRHVRPFRCLFPVTRLSARAIDVLLAKRVAHSRRATRRMLWPNDEALVATTLANGPFVCRDFNSFGRVLYDPETFSFTRPIDGELLQRTAGEVRMLHPVLYGQQYLDKISRLKAIDKSESAIERYCRRVTAKFNSFLAW